MTVNQTIDLSDSLQMLNLLDNGVVLLSGTHVVYLNQAAKTLLNQNTDRIPSSDELFGKKLASEIMAAYLAHHEHNKALPTLYAQSSYVAGDVLQFELKKLGDKAMIVVSDHTRIQHLEQMRTDFIGNVSHELRTPLTVILGYLENFLAVDDMKPAYVRGMKLMQEQAQRMNSLINDLLMLSRLENDESKPKMTVDMPRLLMQVYDSAQAANHADAHAGHLIDIHLDTDKHILGVEAYLYSAISNLVLNAVKYTPAGGEIDILWEEVGDEAVLSITDNGIGIADEHLTRLTERFYRVDSGRSRATGGTGLGLAIVKHVLNKHDARLEVSSKQDQGSTFRIIFPARMLVNASSAHTLFAEADRSRA